MPYWLGPDGKTLGNVQQRKKAAYGVRRNRESHSVCQSKSHELCYQRPRLGVMTVSDEERPALGFSATIAFVGSLDRIISGSVADDVVAVVHETMSNVARHATNARISISLLRAILTTDVQDNGAGTDNFDSSDGLSNLRRRAATHTGLLRLEVPSGDGTHVRKAAVLT